MAGLTPGTDIDHRGTAFTEDLLNRLLNAVRDPTTTRPHIGTAQFDEAQFSGSAGFDGAQFSGVAQFGEARFSSVADFDGAQFSGPTQFDRAQFFSAARFHGAQFSDLAWFEETQFSVAAMFSEAQFSRATQFDRAQFSGMAGFSGAQFSGSTGFDGAQFFGVAQFGGAQFSSAAGFGGTRFSGIVQFGGAQFSSIVQFGGAQFSGDAQFAGAQFLVVSQWGPVVCGGTVDLSGAVFGAPVTLEIAASRVVCTRTRWQSIATIRVRHASVDLGHAVLEAPLAVTAHPTAFSTADGAILDDSMLPGNGVVRVVSVQGVDAAHLVLTDTDLSDCLFSGAFHLDQLRLEGRTTFAFTPTGWHRKGIAPVHWTRRRTLAEEQHWRAQTAEQPPRPRWHPARAPPVAHRPAPLRARPDPGPRRRRPSVPAAA